ncbi:MAG: HD domain-containing protein, partial [Acidobacteria bacterium]|nr:HD domain-containing protein [Acidobacteriota bacterium]
MALHELDDVRKKPATGGGWPWVLGRVEEVTHGGRVARLAVRLGRELGLCGAALRDLAGGALCHDLGKILLPSELLAAPRRLEVEERRRVETHPELGAALLRRLGAPRSWVDVALAHHERWDGGGYPYGLAGADIPLAARIVAVVDTYDAIVSDRPYRP